MVTISLCMIVKNEEDVLARCLASVQDLVDEIIIADTGSTDATKEIAAKFTDHLYDFPWIDDFSAARNFAFSKASMDYCMWLDADDIIIDQDRAGFLELKQTLDPDTDVVMMKYNTGFDANGTPTFSYYRERLLKRLAGFVWQGAVHEVITPRGTLLYSDVAVTHHKLHPSDPDRNLRIFEKLLREGKTLCPREQFYYARELYYHAQYERAIQVFHAFLNDGAGWVENNIDACQHLAYCYYKLGKRQEALDALFSSFRYDTPRAELCCDIGKHFLDCGSYQQAIYWYETAASRNKNDRAGGFINQDCYGYIPYLQLCVCYDRLGDLVKANDYNERAGKEKPDDSIVAKNRRYFLEKMHA